MGYAWRNLVRVAGSYSWVWKYSGFCKIIVSFHKYASSTATGLRVSASSPASIARRARSGRSPPETRFPEAGFSLFFGPRLCFGRFGPRQNPNELGGCREWCHEAAGRNGQAESRWLLRTRSRTQCPLMVTVRGSKVMSLAPDYRAITDDI
jgi:hypothetical protein